MATVKIPNLSNPTEKGVFDAVIEQWIRDDDEVHAQFCEEWNDVDDRLNSDVVVAGMSQRYTDDLAAINSPLQDPDKSTYRKQFVQLNRGRANHEAGLGDFLDIGKRLSIRGRTRKDKKIAGVIQARVEYIEDSEMLPMLVYFPLFDNSFAKGLEWMKVQYNPRANGMKGKFEVSTVNCRDVLVDCRTRGPFFRTARRKTHRFQLSLDEARERYKKYPPFDGNRLAADQEYDQPYKRTASNTEEFATFYEVHFYQTELNHYGIDPETGNLTGKINKEQFEEALSNQAAAGNVLEGDEEQKYYAVLYNHSTGAFAIDDNPYGLDVLIPLPNIESDGRTYPLGDVMIYANLLDLLDVLVTVFVHTAKRTNKPIATGEIGATVLGEIQAQVESALEHGGFAPGVKEVFYQQPANAQLVMNLIQLVIGWIQDAVSKHSATMGELPSKQISEASLQALIVRDRKSQGRKDICITYALTSLAKVLVKMICMNETEPDFFPVLDVKPGSPEYVPVNQKWSEIEYMGHLREMFNIPETGQNPREIQMNENQLLAARKRFESENQVDTEQADGWIIPSFPENQNEYTLPQLVAFQEESGFEEEDFARMYQPEEGKIKMFVVNDLSRDPDLNIKYAVDTDYKNDPQYKANKVITLRKGGDLSRLDLYRGLDEPNPEELIENLRKEKADDQTLELARQLSANPAMMKAVITMIQQVGMKGSPSQPKQPEGAAAQ